MRNGIGSITKLAVAGALILVGAVGMVGAQINVDRMTAKYTVKPIGELVATPSADVTNEKLNINVETFVGMKAAEFGNLGTLKVTTNTSGWDIKMTTSNGGKMWDESSGKCVQVPTYDPFGNPNGFTEDCSAAKSYLQYTNAGTPANVVLDVAIGVAKSGLALGNSIAPTTLYPLVDVLTASSVSTIQPVKVTSITASDVTPVSFAAVIGNAYDGAMTGLYADGINQTSTSAEEWSAIETSGFPAPKENAPGEEFFYVNVGMLPSVYSKLITTDLMDHVFSETFTFELTTMF